MEEKDKLRSFYDNVSSYLDIGGYDEFYSAMQDANRRQKFFDATSQYVDIGDSNKFNSFVDDYFGQQAASQRVDVSDVETAQQMDMPVAEVAEMQDEIPSYGQQEMAEEPVFGVEKPRFAPSYGWEQSQRSQSMTREELDEFYKPKPAVRITDGKREYDFSPENVQAMRQFGEGAYEKAFDELGGLMPDIERVIKEKALFDTEQNNRNKNASEKAIQYHADKEAERRMKQFREKIEKEGSAGFSERDFDYYIGNDQELKDKIHAAFTDKDEFDGYMKAYYQTPEGKEEQVQMINDADNALQGIKGKRSENFWQSVGGMFGEMGLAAAASEGPIDAGTRDELMQMQDRVNERSSVNMAINQQLHEAENTLNIAKKNIEEGEGDAFTKLGRGIRYSDLDNLVPVSELYGQIGILRLYDKLNDDGTPKEPLTDDEQTLYEALALNQYVAQSYGGNVNMLNRIGRGLPEQAEFTLSFLLASEFGGAQVVGSMAEKGAARLISKGVKKQAKTGLKRYLLDKALPTIYGMGVETAYRTALQSPTILSGAIERHTGNIKIDPETGEVGGFENGVDWGEAFWKSTLSVANENATELLGEKAFEPGWAWLGRNTKAGRTMADFRKTIGEIGNGKVDDILTMGSDIRRKAGFNGWAFETLEELAGNFNDAAFIHDQSWKDAFSSETIMETTLNCMIFGMVMGSTTTAVGAMRKTPSTVRTLNEKRKATSIINKMDGITTRELDEHINNDSANELADWLVGKSRQGNSTGDWTDEQRAAVANYVKSSVAQKADQHFKEMKLQDDVKNMEAEVDEMTNKQSGNVVDVNFTVDGQQYSGKVIGGRVSAYEETVEDAQGNPRQAYVYNPNLSSVTLSVRLDTGEKKMISARDVTSVNDITNAEEFKSERTAEMTMAMQQSVADIYKVNSASDIWARVTGGRTVQQGSILPYNDGLVRLEGKDADGNWVLTPVTPENGMMRPSGEPIVVNDFEFRKMGMIEGLKQLQQQGATEEETEEIIDSINTEQTIENVEKSDDENNIWDAITTFMSGYVKTNEEGDFVTDESRVDAAAGYLVSLQKGDIAKTIDILNERIAELDARLNEKPQNVQNNGEGVTVMAANESMADAQAEEIQKQIEFLTSVDVFLGQRLQEQQQMQQAKLENTPVSQMERGQQFPVEWEGQPAMATVIGRNESGVNVVDITDAEGNQLQVGIDDISDEEWDMMRPQPQAQQTQEETVQEAPVEQPIQPEPTPQSETTQPEPRQETRTQLEQDVESITSRPNGEKLLKNKLKAASVRLGEAEKETEKARKAYDKAKAANEAGSESEDEDTFDKETKALQDAEDKAKANLDAAMTAEQVARNEVRRWKEVEKAIAEANAPKEEALVETPTEETQEQPVEETTEGVVPDWVEDTASAARERGYRMVNGERLDRQEPLQGVEGNEVVVKFSDKEKPKGVWKVVEADELQPSHKGGTRNPSFFITEAQPKERTEAASNEASTKIAQNINPEEVINSPTAYIGAPVINSRGEVIQGNNRTIGLQKMYSGYAESAEKYKQAVMEQAERLGLDTEAIAKMKNPVLVRSIDVDDATAIKLGQLTSQDTESGGTQRMDAGRVRNALGDKYERLIQMLFADVDEEEGIGEAIAKNGIDALKYLASQGVINNTQYQSATKNGQLTPEAKEDFRNIIMETLFEGGPDNLRAMFNKLPVRSQNAILQTVYRDAQSTEENKIIKEVQAAIMAFGSLMESQDFAVANTREKVDAAVNGWKNQTNMFEGGTNSEKYSNFALELAKKFKVDTLKNQRQYFNDLYDKLQGVASEGLSMFEEVQQLGFVEAIKAVYGIDYLKPQRTNGISGSNALADNNGRSEEGNERGERSADVGEQEETGERATDSGTRVEQPNREGEEDKGQETIEGRTEVTPEDIEVKADPTATETIVEKGLTMEDIEAAEVDLQTKLLAEDYINGNKNDLTKDAYEEVREYYAEHGRGNLERGGETANGTQLASADNETTDQREGGQRRVQPERVDQEGSEENVPGESGRSENGAQRTAVPTGEQGGGNGNGTELNTSGQPTNGGNTRGSGRNGGNGLDVRQPGGETTGRGVRSKGSERGNQTSQPRTAAEIDKDIADDLAEISGLFKKAIDDSKKLGIAVNPEQQAKEDIAWFRNVRKAIFKLAGHVFEKGYTQFDEWKNKIKDLLHSAIKNFRDKMSDERLDQLLADAWNCPFERDGVVKTMREWADELHAAEVRKMLTKSVQEKQKEQAEANKRKIPNEHGDLTNIREALPFLLPHQQENVAKAERQFFSEEHADREHGYGKGFCFTDGTGTGKTFTGLGIARRFVNEGKGRILIVTTATKVNDWVEDAAKMGLEVESLESVAKKEGKTATRVKGKGIICTTYANLRDNKAVMEDVFDLVIYDESHYIMNNKGGNETISTKTHYMLTNKNIENALARMQEIHPLWVKEGELNDERKEKEAVINNEDASYQEKKDAQERISAIDGLLRQVKEQQNAELPAMREKAAEAAKKTKAVFLSATPFKSIDNLEYAEGYLFSYPEEDTTTKGSGDHRSGKDEFKLRFFGSMFRWRNHRIEEHIQNLDAAVQQQQAFADRLMNTLVTMSGCVLDNGYDYSRHFPLVEVAMADQFNEAVEALSRDPEIRIIGQYFPFDDYNKMSLLFEIMKVAVVIPRVKEHLEKGRKVVFFNRRTKLNEEKSWRPMSPFTEGLAAAKAALSTAPQRDQQAISNAINAFQARYAGLIAWADKLDYRMPSVQLKEAFGDKIEMIDGSVTGKKRKAIIDKFNNDGEEGLDILMGQEVTMREGISIHDTTGKKQRVIITLALPQETTTFLQGEGRIYRIGNKSNAIYEYPLLGINKELSLFALRFNAAVGMTENLAMGSNSRNLARSIAKGVIEDGGVVPLDNQGTGGREKDFGKSTRDAYSSAINDYYSTQKQKAGREGRLGKDYYATPEPLGFKMVQWLNLVEGEEALEPSAGHGAIARYFPGNVRSLAIEPSQALFSMLALNTGGVDKENKAEASGKNRFVQNTTFEELNEVNKYDGIGMNPPFGTAGATAIEHLNKAWNHLRNSGRIAVIVPTGAMDAKMQKWFDEHKNAVVVGEIKLPAVTFEKAGTHVMTRMLLIDRVDRASFRTKVAAKKVSLDMTNIQNIDELFETLRNVDMPSRLIDPSTKLHRHGDALRTKLLDNDFILYKENPSTGRRNKNMGKSFKVTEEGVEFEMDWKATSMLQMGGINTWNKETWNDIKKLKGNNRLFTPRGYVFLSDLAKCETIEDAKHKGLISYGSNQDAFDNAKAFAEAMTEFIRNVSGFTDEQIRDYNDGKVDLFDYTKIKDNAKLTFEDLTRRYEDMEQDPMLQALFERVSTVAERIGMKIETFNDPYSSTVGSYNPLTNTLRINSGRWNNNTITDSEKTQTILHELIHSVTTYALNAYEKGEEMPEALKDACRRTIEIFENIRGDRQTKDYGGNYTWAPSDASSEQKYGFTNPHEMLAEMANPEFRKYLQKKGLWTKLKDGIKRILNYLGLQNLGMIFPTNFRNERDIRWYGSERENVDVALKEGWVGTNAFDEVSEVLDMFLDNFDAAMYERRNDGIIRSKMMERNGTLDEGIKYSIRRNPAPKKTGIGYKVFVLKDGKLYPPMVANPNAADTPVGIWLDADAAPVVGESKTGRPQVKAGGKGTQGGSGQLAYRPGWHLGEIPYALQFNRKDENGEKTLFPKDFVWAEVEYADDVDYQKDAEAEGMTENGKFNHALAGLKRVPENGSYRYRTNPNPKTDPWIITGAMKVNRILTPSEVDEMVREAGREPQRREEGAVTDEQINALNEQKELYRDQEREYGFGETLPITKNSKGEYQVEGLTETFTNLDRLLDAWRDNHTDYFAEIRNGKLYVEPWNLPEPKTAKGNRYVKKNAERNWRNMQMRADDTIKKLGLQDRVSVLESNDGLEGKKRRAKGWYDPQTGQIVIVLSNHGSPMDVVKTILHEGVAHYGLRQLVGEENFNEFLDTVFANADSDVRKRIIDLAMDKYNRNFRKATEEYLATLAETTKFENEGQRSWFQKVKGWFVQMLYRAGIDVNELAWGKAFGGLSDNELRYMLWKSYRNLVANADSRSEIARDTLMQSQLGVGEYGETVAAESMARENHYSDMSNDELFVNLLTDKNEIDNEILTEIIRRVQNDTARVSRLPKEEVGGKNEIPSIAAQAIARGVRKAGRRALWSDNWLREERRDLIKKLVKQWAEQNGYWYDESRLLEGTKRAKDLDGSESYIYVSNNDDFIRKLTFPNQYYGYIQGTIESDQLFSSIFPETAYEIKGFGETKYGQLCIVVEQPFISGMTMSQYALKQGESSASLEWMQYKIDEYMENLGFDVVGYARYLNDKYRVNDVHEHNVIVDEKGNMFVIDANVSLANNEDYDGDDGLLFRDSTPDNAIAEEYDRMTGANVDGVSNKVKMKEQFIRDWIDSLRPLEQLQKLVEKTLGRKLRDSEKAYELATLLPSLNKAQMEKAEAEVMLPVLRNASQMIRRISNNIRRNDKGKSKKDARKDAREILTNYMLAKHGLERNDWFEKNGKDPGDYSGLRGLAKSIGENPDNYKDVAQHIVDDFEADFDGKEIDQYWSDMKALSDYMLKYSYDSGMIDKDKYDELKSRHKFYVPLRGFADGTSADMYDYIVKSPQFQNIFKKAEGRESKADDPLSNIYNMLQSAIVIGNQNKVMQNIYNLMVNSKSDLLRANRPWYVFNDVTGEWEERFPDIPENATADEIDAIVKQFDSDMQQAKANGKAKRKLNRIDVGKRVLPYNAKEHELVAYVDGQKVVMHIAGNPLVAQQLNRMNNQTIGKFFEKIQPITRAYAMINTTLSPAFMFTNASRDIGFTLFSATVTGGVKKNLQTVGNLFRAAWVLPRLIITGKMNGGITKMFSNEEAAKMEQWWNEFLENGGETGFTRTLSAEKMKTEVDGMINAMLSGSKDGENRLKKYTAGIIEQMGRFSEDISRFAAYCVQRAHGESVKNSINEAKNVTVNFNVKGGSRLAAEARSCYAFFNAALQGINRMARLMNEHPKAFGLCLATCVLQGAALPWLNMAMFALLGGDDDDWLKYEYLTEYTANHNLILYVGNHKFLKVQYSQELAPFAAMGNIFFRQMMGWNKGRSVGEQVSNMFLDLLPVNIADGRKPVSRALKTILPSVATPLLEAGFNEDFTGSPIYKENNWNKYDSAWQKAYEGKTSQWFVDASKYIDDKTRGTWYHLDINPAIAEHLLSGVLGGLGRSGDKLMRFFSNGFQLQDAPYIRTMMFDSNPQGYIGAITREYGRLAYDELPREENELKKMNAEQYAREVYKMDYKVLDLVAKYKTGKDLVGNNTNFMGIDKMEKAYKKALKESDGSEESKEALESMKSEINEVKMEMLDEIEQLKYENSGTLRKRVMERVWDIEQKSKEKYERRHGNEEE